MAHTSTIVSSRPATGSARSLRDCLRWWLASLAFIACAPAIAGGAVERILAAPEAPLGVVFEIVEGDQQALQVLLPGVRESIARIRARFPQVRFAVVSHGREEFALQTKHRSDNAEIHAQVQALVANDVSLHVCGTHAGWYGVSPEDFPEYVDVAPSGPAQINLYRELGYELVVVD